MRQLDGDLEHVLAEERHPGRAVGLLEVAAGRQRRAAVEDADVVEAEEPALEHVVAVPVLAVHPPGEVEEQLVERLLEPLDVAAALLQLVEAVGEDGGPGVHRRVDVAEVPFVGGQLAVGVQVIRACSIRSSCSLPKSSSTSVRASTWNARSQAAYQGYSHLSGIEMMSALYMWCQCSLRGARAPAVGEGVRAALLEPPVDVVVVELLRPQHAGDRLAHRRAPGPPSATPE